MIEFLISIQSNDLCNIHLLDIQIVGLSIVARVIHEFFTRLLCVREIILLDKLNVEVVY